MTRAALVQQMIDRLGTSQPERGDPRLDPAHAPVDGRDLVQLLRQVRALAQRLPYYRVEGEGVVADGNWSPWFEASDAALFAQAQRSDGLVPPHQALLLAFLRQREAAQSLIDGFTARHLQFQMRQVLGFEPRPEQPDRAHLLLQLKPGTAPVEITPDHAFSAGPDALRRERLYRPVRKSVIGAAEVRALCGLRRDGDRLISAPVAASADGFGAELRAEAPRWPPFARQVTRAAPVGFAFATPQWRLSGGERRLELALTLGGWQQRHEASAIGASLDAWLTGPKGWIGPFAVQASRSGDELLLAIELPASEVAVVDHAQALHQQRFADGTPVLQLLLRDGAPMSFGQFDGLTLRKAVASVSVRGLKSLKVENDFGTLDARKAFMPFGGQPVTGSRFFVGSDEVFSKPLTKVELRLQWQGAPADLVGWYAGYAKASQMASVSAVLTFHGPDGAQRSHTLDLMARDADGVSHLSPDSPPPVSNPWKPGYRMRSLVAAGSGVARRTAELRALALPLLRSDLLSAAAPVARAGFLTVQLIDDFLHGDHRGDAVRALLDKTNPKAIREPYTPMVGQIALDYAARSAPTLIERAEPEAFTDTDLHAYHVDAFGCARVHAWLGAAQPGGASAVPLMAPHAEAGALMIGLAGVRGGDAVHLLFQAAEGSADPEATPQALRWSVLADNGWCPLAAGDLVLDTSNELRRSGLVSLVLPRATSTANTLLAPGLAWLRASVAAEPSAVCDLIGVHANAVEVVFDAQPGNAPHGGSALPAGSIAKARPGPASLKSVAQPYAGFGGAAPESDAALARRAAERLRHRNRAITPWDFERIALEAFPELHRVKCIPHASPSSWFAPGNVMLVVVPDLRNRHAVDPLRPRADIDTLQRVQRHLHVRCAAGVRVWVRHPAYRAVKLSFALALQPGRDFNHGRAQVHEALMRALSPWAFDAAVPVGFGGRVDRSTLLGLVESLDGVDHVSDFRLTVDGEPDVPEAQADAPDAILVSAPEHDIVEAIDD